MVAKIVRLYCWGVGALNRYMRLLMRLKPCLTDYSRVDVNLCRNKTSLKPLHLSFQHNSPFTSDGSVEHLLLRDFVFRSLYGPQGYFEQRTVVGSAEAVLYTKPNQKESYFIEMVQLCANTETPKPVACTTTYISPKRVFKERRGTIYNLKGRARTKRCQCPLLLTDI